MLRLAIEPDEPEALGRVGWLPALRALLGPRGARAATAALAVLALSLLAVSGMPRRLAAWVHDRPAYAWSVDAIALDPPPPPWLPGGRDRLIAGAAETLAAHDGGSALDVPLDAVERAFKNQRWVDRVERIRRAYPGRVVVSLRYRDRPVAVVAAPGPTHCVVGASASVLATASSESELDEFGPLIRLDGIEPPADTEPGSPWLVPGEGAPGVPNPVAAAAASLALALLEDVEARGPFRMADGRELRIIGIQPLGQDSIPALLRHQAGERPSDPQSSPSHLLTAEEVRRTQAGQLYILLGHPDGIAFWVYWGNPPGSEAPGKEVPAPEKLAMLRDWLSSSGADALDRPGALAFSRDGASWADRL